MQDFLMGGTGLEPVTPSLSSLQGWWSPFAEIVAYVRVCSDFVAFSGVAFARIVRPGWVFVLAPVSTAVERWPG
jgi:hypothetical protein